MQLQLFIAQYPLKIKLGFMKMTYQKLFTLVLVYICVSEGSPLSWWFGGPGAGRVQTYWGGAQPGSQQCACGLQGDCVDLQHYCNCDADRMEWY